MPPRLFHSVAYSMVLAIGLTWGYVGTATYYTYCHPGLKCTVQAPRDGADVKRASVKIECRDGGHGSGTIGWIDRELYVLTAEHVAGQGHKVKVGLEACGEVSCWIEAECIAASVKHDLALLKLAFQPAGTFPSLVPVSGVTVGEDVLYCGWGGDCPLYLEKSIIQSEDCRLWPAKGKRNFLVGGNGQAGNSGSGIWVKRDKGWQLAGVLVAGWSRGQPIICVHPESVVEFLRDRPKERTVKTGFVEIILG